MIQQFGKLTFQPSDQAKHLLGAPVAAYLHKTSHEDVWVSQIDPNLADTATFCKQYEVGMEVSANCVVVEAKRGEKVWYAACVILATAKADVNGVVRRTLEARKTSFASMDTATSLTSMEYGGITPVGLPSDWPIFIDSEVLQHKRLIVGSGIRGSKILITPKRLQSLPNAKTLDITKN